MLRSWLQILSGLVGFLKWLARIVEETRIRADERNRIELEARREADDLDARVDHGLEQLQRDRAAIEADPRNRDRREVDPVQDHPKEVP